LIDWSSFGLGAGLGAIVMAGVGAVFKGFGTEAGKALWKRMDEQRNPPHAEVPRDFVPTAFSNSQCAWVSHTRLYEFEQKDWRHYPHPKTRGPVYRMSGATKEYLMVGPDATPLS
jgi:hypothetical protein